MRHAKFRRDGGFSPSSKRVTLVTDLRLGVQVSPRVVEDVRVNMRWLLGF